MASRPLNAIELDAYDLVPRELAARARIHRVPGLPGGYAGMTLGSRILLARDEPADGTSTLLAHELVHVRQWADQGIVRFSVSYVTSFARGLWRHRRWRPAYLDVEAEIEAREDTSRWLHRRLTRRPPDEPEGLGDGDGDGPDTA